LKLPFVEIIESIAPDPNLLLWKFPDQDMEIKNGAKLIVRESQSALLIYEGKIADVFGPGSHTLSTKNIPFLSNLKSWKYGLESPFKVDIYFLNTHPFLNNKWGTPSPIIMRDPEFGQVRIRAFGSYDICINDPVEFFCKYAGTYPVLTIQELQHQLRDFIAPNFGEILAVEKMSILDVSRNVNNLSLKVKPLIMPYFQRIGIELIEFIVTSVTLPDEVQSHLDQLTEMNMVGDLDQFMKFNTAKATMKTGTSVAEGVASALMVGAMSNQMNLALQDSMYSKGENSVSDRLKKLKELHDSGLLDESEYKAKKSALIELL
jgi:membrane protease subunit (stomatin/prohibitin family)